MSIGIYWSSSIRYEIERALENDENDDITCHLFSRYNSFEDFDMLVAGLIFSVFEAFKM